MLILSVAALPMVACADAASEGARPGLRDDVDRIHPNSENPRFWVYGGRTRLLIGGTDDHNLFQWTGTRLTDQLDLLASAGGNYVRNTMSSREQGNIWQFHRVADGRYDLERPNPEYYVRLETLLREALERDIVVQIELWDRFDFAREPWLENPFRPASNINYTVEEGRLADEYPRHPASNDNPFFRTVPEHDDNQRILRYQQAHIDRVLEVSLRYPNVLYTMDNETRATAEWAAYWAKYIQRTAAEVGTEVYTTEMWNHKNLKDEMHRRSLDHPEIYPFVEISQNSHNTGEEHWDNLQWVREYTASRPRPLNNVKIYGADTGRFGTDRDAVERFWRNLLGGAASVRFHRPPSGIGLNELAQRHIRSAHMLLAEFDVTRSVPDAAHARLSGREENEAYLSYIEDEQYAVYFPDGGEVALNLGAAAGPFVLRWLEVAASRWAPDTVRVGGSRVELLRTPGAGGWVALITRG